MHSTSNPTAVLTDDRELTERVVGGDQAAFESLMRAHNRRLYRVARAILKDDAEAEEALQEAYLIAYRNMASFKGKSKLSTWLTRIVINEALQRLRKNKRADAVVPFGPTDFHSASIEHDGGSETPERAALRGEMRELLEREIDRLPVAFRTVFILREVEDLSVEETAECLDLPAATVRTRLFRAKSQLRESLAQQLDVITQDTFGFAGERCERIVRHVLAAVAAAPEDKR